MDGVGSLGSVIIGAVTPEELRVRPHPRATIREHWCTSLGRRWQGENTSNWKHERLNPEAVDGQS